MKYHAPTLAGALALMAGPAVLASDQAPPSSIGHHLQLFLDSRMIEHSENLNLQLHSPQPAEVALKFDAAWEGSSNMYVTVLKDDDRYRMYYHSAPHGAVRKFKNPSLSYTAYAESTDGIVWQRPDLGLFEFQGSKHNNIVWPNYGSEVAAILVPVRNGKPGASPDMRYLATGTRHKSEGLTDARLYLFASADAIHWRQISDRPIMSFGGSTFYRPPNFLDSVQYLFWSEADQEYFLYLRDQWIAPGTGELMRGLRFARSKDLVNWSYPEWIHLNPNPADQFYTAAPAPYFREPTVFICFTMRYMEHRYSEMPTEYEINRGRGVSDLAVMSSRDGLHWDRTFMEAFIRPGLDPLKWTDRSNSAGPGPVPTGPNEMSIYVVEYLHLKGTQVRRFTIRDDGIGSMHAGYDGGSFVTKPIIFSGHRLSINAATSAEGGIRVEVLTAKGEPIDRFSGLNTLELFGDAIDREVRWDQGPDIGPLAGTPIRLRFLMKDADLFSYHFKD